MGKSIPENGSLTAHSCLDQAEVLPYSLVKEPALVLLAHFGAPVQGGTHRTPDPIPKQWRPEACHRSQKDWLDKSQGRDSYLKTMNDMCAQLGRASGRFAFAEGWQRHLHLGFGSEELDPLTEALGGLVRPAADGDEHG